MLSPTSTSNPSNRGAREERAGRTTRKKKKSISVRNNEDAKDIARKHARGASATAPHCSGQETEIKRMKRTWNATKNPGFLAFKKSQSSLHWGSQPEETAEPNQHIPNKQGGRRKEKKGGRSRNEATDSRPVTRPGPVRHSHPDPILLCTMWGRGGLLHWSGH